MSLVVLAGLLGGAGSALLGLCGPFTDVAEAGFCPFVLEIFILGITKGTTPTTYSPDEPVSRLQASAFLSRTVDSTLLRGSRRAALGQFWTSQRPESLGQTGVAEFPQRVACDGSDIWVSSVGEKVTRVRASDGKRLEVWTGAIGADGIFAAMGSVFVAGAQDPGRLYRIDPTQPAGAVTTVASNLGAAPQMIAFDGARIWTANSTPPGSVSLVTPGPTIPWSVTTVSVGFTTPLWAVFDGTNMWVADQVKGLLRLDSSGAVLQTVTMTNAASSTFDGTNIWVPRGDRLSVVRAASGAVLTTLTGNGLSGSRFAAFDGERILVTATDPDSVSLWKAADLSPLGSFSTGVGTSPAGVCSDGLNFWIALFATGLLERF